MVGSRGKCGSTQVQAQVQMSKLMLASWSEVEVGGGVGDDAGVGWG